MKCRRRLAGGPNELADALAPHMEFAGALRYLDQEPAMAPLTINKSKLQPQPLKCALLAMYGLAETLSLTKSCMAAALGIVADKIKSNFDPDAACEYQ